MAKSKLGPLRSFGLEIVSYSSISTKILKALMKSSIDSIQD